MKLFVLLGLVDMTHIPAHIYKSTSRGTGMAWRFLESLEWSIHLGVLFVEIVVVFEKCIAFLPWKDLPDRFSEGNMPQLYLNNQLLVVCLLQPIGCILAGGFLLIKKHINMNQSNHMNIIWAGYLWGFAEIVLSPSPCCSVVFFIWRHPFDFERAPNREV